MFFCFLYCFGYKCLYLYVNQNSGVRIEARDGLGRKIQYFGIIEEMWELDYGRDITVALFRCRWIKQHQLNEIGLRILDLENLGYQDDPWVLASRVAQVFCLTLKVTVSAGPTGYHARKGEDLV